MQAHYIERCQLRYGQHKQGRNDGEVFGYVVSDRERSQRTASHQQLFTDFDNFDQLGRVIIEVDHVTGLFSCLRTTVHRYTHICLSQCRGIVRTIAHHGNQLTSSLFFLDVIHLVFGLSLRNKIIYAGFLCNIFGCQRVITGYHYRFYTHLAQTFETFYDTGFYDILQFYDTGYFLIDTYHKRSTAVTGYLINNFFRFFGERIPSFGRNIAYRIISTFTNLRSVFQVDTRTFRFGRKFDHLGTFGIQTSHTHTDFVSQLNNRFSFGSIVRYRRHKTSLNE